MRYRGQDLDLAGFMAKKEAEYNERNRKEDWHDSEDIVWAVQDYISSCGPLEPEDRKFLLDYDPELIALADDEEDEIYESAENGSSILVEPVLNESDGDSPLVIRVVDDAGDEYGDYILMGVGSKDEAVEEIQDFLSGLWDDESFDGGSDEIYDRLFDFCEKKGGWIFDLADVRKVTI